MNEPKTRLDKYLWAIWIFKTRSLAGNAIDNGKVKMNGVALKSSHPVKPGEEYHINTKEKKWVIVVVAPLDKRMSATLVMPFFKDITPPEELERIKLKTVFFFSNGGRRGNSWAGPLKRIEDYWMKVGSNLRGCHTSLYKILNILTTDRYLPKTRFSIPFRTKLLYVILKNRLLY